MPYSNCISARRSCLGLGVFVAVCFATGTARGDASADQGDVFFEAKIRPILVKHCYKCHSAESGKSHGGLQLDTRQAVRQGGDRGPAVVPGNASESWLLTAIAHSDPDLRMPPDQEPLSQAVLADFETWIKAGAADPREADAQAVTRKYTTIEEGRQFWTFQKPRRSEPPKTSNPDWARRELDHFILAELEKNRLSPSEDAAPSTLLRRLHFDLIGLPPSPEALGAFLDRVDRRGMEQALEAEVDSLLESARFGERWGRHWLDVARFAESSGKEANISFPYAWRYRDYVIDSINTDVPYDQFLAEQIAGDLLPYDSDVERERLLIATGFLALGPKNLDEANVWQFLADVIDEQIDTVTRAVMASSVACARCHDHKFDPFSMEDYYALAGVFASTNTHFGTFVSPANRVGGDPLVLPKVEGQKVFHPSIPAKRVKELQDQLAALQKEQADGMAAVKAAIAEGKDPTDLFTLRDALRIFWQSGGIEGQLEKVDEHGKALPLAMGVLDRERIVDVPLLERGEINRPGDRVPRGFPEVIELADCSPPPSDQSGRLQLAQWLTHPDHPLTARVMVNRVWHHLFGVGIVRTVDNFGFNGERPSHPELLDNLAIQFVDHGWSLKQLVRELVLSRTYGQSSAFDEQAFQKDPENRLRWRADKRRLEAEAIRDAMLAVSGELDTTRPDGSLVARVIGDRPISLIGLDKRIPKDLDDATHRSVYLPVLRDRLPDVLDLFDFAEPSLVTGVRETTNVPLQALYLLNSPFVQARSEAFAKRLSATETREEQVREALLSCFSRPPEPDELASALDFLDDASALHKPHDGDSQLNALATYCQALLATAEFRNLD